MEDMDVDELLGNSKTGANRQTRFAPKGSRFKPKVKTEPAQSLPPSTSMDVDVKPAAKKVDVDVPKKVDVDVSKKVDGVDAKPAHANDAIDVDVHVKPDVKEEEGGDLMETEAGEVKFEPEDEVVRQIDVYFTTSIDPQTRLYVLQYPLRPIWRPYELEERCEEVRVKLESAEVEIDLAIAADSKNYDSGADPRVHMKKQTLSPSWKPPQTSGCVVGVLSGNKLHLNPIHAIVQLRPSMHHLDSVESKRKAPTRSNVDDAVKLETHQEAKPSGTTKKMTKILEQTKDMGEGWIPLEYRSVWSDTAAGYLQKLIAQEGSQIHFSMSSYDYLNSLCPGTFRDNFSSKIPRRSLLPLPLSERFKIWLQKGPPIHKFGTLKYLAPDESLEEVLEVLQEHARLVQGLWMPKSSLVYGTDQGADVLARDYVLILFSKDLIIKESQLLSQSQLNKLMREALKVLATHRPAFEDWKLKELPDLSFIKLNPHVVKKQEEEWECLEKKINDLLGRRNGPGAKNSSKSNTANNLTTLKASNKLTTKTSSGSTRTGMSEEVREAIVKALQRLFKDTKVCSFQQISQRLRDMAVSESARSTGFAREAVAAANSIDAFPGELQAIIAQVAVNIHGICVPISSPDNKKFDPFRKVVIDLFLAEGPNAKLKKATIFEAAKMQLEREISQIEYQKVLQELCVSQGSAWVLRSADGNSTR